METETDSIVCRPPTIEDGRQVHDLISRCPPLDVNTVYAYLLLCRSFADTCAVAERGGRIVGFMSGFREPARPDTLFLWQIAVDETARGAGLARRMLDDILARNRDLGWIEATVAPDNAASRRFFQKLAEAFGVELHVEPCFEARHFGAQAHDDEELLRLGPLPQPS